MVKLKSGVKMDNDEWRKAFLSPALQSIIDNNVARNLSLATIAMPKINSIVSEQENSILSISRQFDSLIKTNTFKELAIHDSALNFVKNMNFANSNIEAFSSIIKNYTSVINNNIEAFPQLKPIIDTSFLDAIKQITRVTSFLPENVLHQIEINAVTRQAQFSQAQAAIEALSQVQDFNLENFEEQEENINFLIKYFMGKIQSASSVIELKTFVSLFIGVILPLIMFVYSLEEAAKSEDRLTNLVEERFEGSKNSFDEVMEAISKLNENMELVSEKLEIESAVFYEVKNRPVELFANNEADPDKDYVTWLYPGQTVELIERDKKWIRVIAYDPLTDATHVGWVMKKYLKMIR